MEAAQGAAATDTTGKEAAGGGDSQAEAAGSAEAAAARGAKAGAGSSRSMRLRHVYVQAGSKWYGQHLGKYKTPAKETDPRWV